MKVYLIYGQSGNHNERQTWNVIVFKSKEHAEYYKKILEAFLLDHNIPNHLTDCYVHSESQEIPYNPDDPYLNKILEASGCGVEYGIEEIEYIQN